MASRRIGKLSGATVRWLEGSPFLEGSLFMFVSAGVCLFARPMLDCAQASFRGGIVAPGNTGIRQVGLRAASVYCKSLASPIAQLIVHLTVDLTLHMVAVREL